MANTLASTSTRPILPLSVCAAKEAGGTRCCDAVRVTSRFSWLSLITTAALLHSSSPEIGDGLADLNRIKSPVRRRSLIRFHVIFSGDRSLMPVTREDDGAAAAGDLFEVGGLPDCACPMQVRVCS